MAPVSTMTPDPHSVILLKTRIAILVARIGTLETRRLRYFMTSRLGKPKWPDEEALETLRARLRAATREL